MKTLLLGLALIAAAPAAAQDMAAMDMAKPKPVCVKAAVVPGFEGWGKGTPASQLVIGGFASLALAPAETVKFTPPLNRAPKPGDMGGAFAVSIKTAGTYRFAINPGAWIDVLGSNGARLESVAHMHGPDCSGIGKIVDYALPAGKYVVQLSSTQAATLQAMVIAR